MGALTVMAVLLVVGFVFGGLAERKHKVSLNAREERLRQSVMMTQLKSYPRLNPEGKAPELLLAETVISSDYLKTFLAGIRNFFGGEVRSFQGILERARREAMIQLAERAEDRGFNAVCNVRLETAQIGGKRKGVMMAAIQATATGYDCLDDGLIPAPSKAESEARATGRRDWVDRDQDPYRPPASY